MTKTSKKQKNKNFLKVNNTGNKTRFNSSDLILGEQDGVFFQKMCSFSHDIQNMLDGVV